MMNPTKLARYTSVSALLAMLLVLSGCTDDFSAINTPEDQINVDELDESLLGQAFAQSQFVGMYGQPGPFQLSQSLYGDLYAQYFATTAQAFDSDQFQEIGGWSNGAWRAFYADAAPQLHLVEEFTAEQDMEVENAVAKVWRVQLYHRITDYWGPIIYSEFGSGETSVGYDSQEAVYKNFFAVLDSARAVLEANLGAEPFGTNDQVYEGNAEQWLKLANSLQLRLAMRVRYVEPALAQTEAEEAVASGVIEDNADNAMLLTTQNSRNPYTTITDWGEFRMSSTMESTLEGYEDPRISEYYSPAVGLDANDDDVIEPSERDSDGDGSMYEGMRNGLPRTEKDADLNNAYSDMHVKWMNDSRGGSNPPIPVMRAAEVYFLRAEGALQGWNMGGTAQDLYEEGIRTSLQERTDASSADISAYISSTNTPISPDDAWGSGPVSDIPVAWSAVTDAERHLQQIITQKWIAIYPDGREAWAEYRRTKYPVMYPIIESLTDIPEDGMVRRLTFVSSERTENKAATEAAVDLLQNSSDENSTRLWWDAK